MLSNSYFLANFRFDTAENEPAKNLQNFAKFANFARAVVVQRDAQPRRPAGAEDHARAVRLAPQPDPGLDGRPVPIQADVLHLLVCLF